MQPWSSLVEHAPAFTWRQRLGTLFDNFHTAFLNSEESHAISVPCPCCGCAHAVVAWTLPHYTHPNGAQINPATSDPPACVALCQCSPASCPEIPLSNEEAMVLTLSWPRFGRALARAFGFDTRERELGISRTRQIGAFGSAAIPVVLTIQHGPRAFLDTVTQLLARLRERFILLAPTNAFIDATTQERLVGASALFCDLESNTVLTAQGMLHARKTAGELFSRILPAESEANEDVAARVFALIGRMEDGIRTKPPSVLNVFRLYCVQELSAREVAIKCHCSKTLVLERLKAIRAATGIDPEFLRRYSSQFDRMESNRTDSRARRIYQEVN